MPPRRYYTDEEAAWIADEAPRATNSRAMAEAFEGRFGRRMPPVTLRTYCRTHGIAAGWQGTRDRSASHRTACGRWVEGGVKMTDAQHDWWLAHGEMPPAGTNVLRAPDGMELATDGEPLEVGQTVWDTDAEADTPLTVVEVSSDLVRCEYTWKDGKTYRPCYPPSALTHERPDSWERLERDANASTCTYFGATTKDCEICGHVSWECSYDKASDLVRRAKALAERERGE